MKGRIALLLPSCALTLALLACGLAPSRAPLGGNYAVADPAPRRDVRPEANDRTAELQTAETVPNDPPSASVLSPATATAAPKPSSARDVLHYVVLKTGDVIKAELSVSFTALLVSGERGMSAGDGALGLDAKFGVEISVTRASALTIEELELTLTPGSVRTEISGKVAQLPHTPSKTFDVIAAGRSAGVRERGGATLDARERVVLMLLVTPLLEFHEHWARALTLDLQPGWSRETALSVPAFLTNSGDTMHIGPFKARYEGRDAGSLDVPFRVALPLAYATELGKLDFELTGVAHLDATRARPLDIELHGPVNGSAGPRYESSFHGSAKFAATFSYP